MNYIRGAVSAISAPYQYYKDLPPLNPSTLTGAIDVIVVQRPADNGDTELVCSPFHVRFGKWQVLRPGEKKVNVSVNGHPIPFNMKIGEAGEAFFVFETDDDIPDDLITSPILHPTNPEESVEKDVGIHSDRFGAKQDLDDKRDIEPDQEGRVHTKNEEEIRREDPETQEPDFLDLNAPPSPPHDDAFKNADTTPKQTFSRPSMIQRPPHVSISQPEQAFPSPPPTPGNVHTPETIAQDKRVDAAVKAAGKDLHVPEVEYHHDIALDVEGYHSHGRERSDRTVRSSEGYSSPSGSKTRSATPSPVRGIPHTQSMQSSSEGLHFFPSFRATSEPPPDTEEEHGSQPPPRHDEQASSSSSKLSILTPVQEYSWEWGAFPQPSPMKTSFGKGGRIEGGLGRSWGKRKGKAKASMEFSGMSPALYEEENMEEEEHGRSRSVPPELDGSPKRDRRGRELPEEYDEPSHGDMDGNEGDNTDEEEEFADFGKGGKLTTTSADPTTFVLSIEGKKATFELSLASHGEGRASTTQGTESDPEDGDYSIHARGRKNRHGGVGRPNVLAGRDEVEAARLFDLGRVDFYRFLNDDELVNDPRLVIRWAGDQYITRKDGSPLMHALVAWRDAARQQRINGGPSRPTSPSSRDELEGAAEPSPPPSADELEQPPDRMHHARSKSEPPEKPLGKPTSSSWVQWWSSSRQNTTKSSSDVGRDKDIEAAPSRNERPEFRGTTSAPLHNGAALPSSRTQGYDMKRILRDIPPAESAPALPSTPVQEPVKDVPLATPRGRKFAKTLRLTSDQLKALNLKPGANTITFSLSTSGAIACTARIFVWDSTDLVVISDIDGTITKSDGLGHVFAMIGRDWTHLGVAKLYTDITRNGYKIMYLTSRAIGQADATRDYLKGIKQNDYQLPEGPVIMSPDRLMASLHREVIMRKPEVFKMACLRDIQRLFGEASRNPFSAGFGNRITDALSYRSVNVPSARIFTIDSAGEVKMELLELAGYKSSYIHMTDLVDQMFPPIHRKWTPEFTDFNYWKQAVQEYPLPDLSPPSPALSARSDTSNRSALARLRNFSLVGSRQGTMRMSHSGDTYPGSENDTRNTDLRQISSFEKLSNTLGFAQTSSLANGNRRSVSPESQSSGAYDSEDEDEDLEMGADGRHRKRERRRSMTSMPGTLDEMHFGMDDDDDDDNYDDNYGDGGDEELEDDMVEGEEDAGDEAFDEDLLAAGEMKNVPFL